MNRIIRLTNLGFALSAMMIAGPVQAGEPPPPNLAGTVQQTYCMSGYLDYTDPNAYFTPVFEVRVPQNAKPSYPEDLARIYESYLNQKYGYVRTGPMSVICTLSVSAAAVQGGKDILIKDRQYRHQAVVETGWKPSPQEILAAVSATAAPSTPATPKPNPPLAVQAFCKSDPTGTKVYFSKVFSVAITQPTGQPFADQVRPLTDAWKKSLNAFLSQNYGYQGSTDCVAGEEFNPVLWTWGRLRGLALGRGVDTDWSPAG